MDILSFIKNSTKSVLSVALACCDKFAFRKNLVFVESPRPLSVHQQERLRSNLEFYFPQATDIVFGERSVFRLTGMPRLIFGREKESTWLRFLPNTYFVDSETEYLDGWEWSALSNHSRANFNKALEKESRSRFFEVCRNLEKIASSEGVFVFGTGPALQAANQQVWDKGIKIVCNTIVRDSELWSQISPHIVVAGDAIYHFGNNRHSALFLHDLRQRLESDQTVFIYPLQFDAVVRRALRGLENRLIPIQIGRNTGVVKDLRKDFTLPSVGNVLNLLLLPVATTLGKKVYLWGFDGRSPDAKFFWKNSAKQSYSEHMQELRELHPAFFRKLVPVENPNRYVNSVHGDGLDEELTTAEAEGFEFTMLHPSWTPSFQKRYRGNLSYEQFFEKSAT